MAVATSKSGEISLGSDTSTPSGREARITGSSLTVREREAGPDMDAKSQVGTHTAERRRSVEVSARKIETIARSEHRINQRRFFSPFLDVSFAIVPRLIT